MTPTLRDHFDRAVGDDPGAALGDLARTAILDGGRLRRRRQLVTAGVAAGLVAILGAGAGAAVSLRDDTARPPITLAAAMMPRTAPACVPHPVDTDATDAAVFLTDELTGGRASAVETALRADPRVAAVEFESRAEAYRKFTALWADSPDFVAAVDPAQIPESFRLRLVEPGQYTALQADYSAMPGVQLVSGRRCTADAPVGGLL
ncbi:permease-like cell division protein FtsX [Actinoplanes missouriensis]|uniref:permease-like cell division protein FtsX n=1 Tax=Actinoplanes missouriensis TaxID=1866 RepID=UPI0002E6170F|nr:permease-like cell division protein FtsX [Actinoplanes missouriensis]